MYRRLKNILGVSLIIFAIVLSQIPMGDVLADGEIISEADSGEEIQDEEVALENTPMLLADGDEDDPADGTDGTTDSVDDTGTTSQTIEIYYNFGFDGVTLGEVDNLGNGVKNGNTITFSDVSAGGVTVPKPNTIQISGIDAPQNLVKDSEEYTINNVKYYFKGWFEEGQGQEFNFMVPATGNKIINAKWVPVVETPCTVTFVAAGFKPETQTITVNAGDTVPEPKAGVGEFQMPTMTGSEIVGWKDEVGNRITEWTFVIDRDRTFTAIPDTSTYEVTFHMKDGATYNGSNTYTIEVGYNTVIQTENLPKEADIVQPDKDLLTDSGVWYTDVNCTAPFDMNTSIAKKTDLYKKWYRILALDGTTTADKGFHISADGKVLYKFDGNDGETGSIDVVIPETVITIAPNAFSDMTSIKSVTLPPNIGNVMVGSFSGMKNLGRKVTLHGTSPQASAEGNNLVTTYPDFVYMSSQTGSQGAVVNSPWSSLYYSNTAEGNDGFNTYVSVRTPKLPDGIYLPVFEPYDTQSSSNFPQLVEAAVRITDPNRFFYMNIEFNKDGAAFDGYNEQEVFKVSLPLPTKWQTKKEIDVDGKIRVFTTKYKVTPKELEEISVVDVAKNDASGVYCVEFETWHFSEYVIVYSGSMEDRVTNSNSPAGNTGSPSGGGNNGNTASSGGSGSSGNSGSSGSGGNSGGSGSGGSSGSGGGTPSASTTPTITPVTPVVPVVPGIQPAVTPTGTGAGAAHVKDSTPKTGDPMEYRSLLVCCLFSMGVLILCMGNKKKNCYCSHST